MRGYMGACQNDNVKELEIYHKGIGRYGQFPSKL